MENKMIIQNEKWVKEKELKNSQLELLKEKDSEGKPIEGLDIGVKKLLDFFNKIEYIYTIQSCIDSKRPFISMKINRDFNWVWERIKLFKYRKNLHLVIGTLDDKPTYHFQTGIGNLKPSPQFS